MKFLGCTHRVKARRSSHIIAARRSLAAQQSQGVGLAHHRVLFNHPFFLSWWTSRPQGRIWLTKIFHEAQELQAVGAGGLGGQSPQKDESRCHLSTSIAVPRRSECL